MIPWRPSVLLIGWAFWAWTGVRRLIHRRRCSSSVRRRELDERAG